MKSTPGNRGILLALAAAALVAAGCSASAKTVQPKAEAIRPDPPAVAAARAEYQKGREAALAGDYQCAEEAFARALEFVRPANGDPPTDLETIAFSDELYAGILRSEALFPTPEAELQESQDAQKTPELSPTEADATPADVARARQAVDTDSATIRYDIPIVVNDSVLRILAVYQNQLHDIIGRGLARSGRFIPMIERIFAEEGLPRDLAQVAMVESSFIPRARSPKAACGIWQFIPSTGRDYGLTSNSVIDERNDPEKSTRAAARYLKFLHELFHDWYLAMAAYNAGEGKILRVMAKTGFTDFWQIAASGLIKPQTVNYVPGVIASTLIARNPAHYGFEVEYEKPLAYDLVRLDRPVTLRSLAAAEGVELEDLQRLNPELRTEVTPGGPGGYDIKVPVGSQVAVLTAFAAAPTARPPSYRRYTAHRGDTIASVARRFKLSPAAVSSANGLPQNASLKKGKVVLIPKPEPVRVASKSVKPSKASRASSGTDLAKVKPKTAPAEPVQTAAKHYTVRGGDTLYRIAVKHGTTVAQLLAFNSLIAPSTIKPGDTLKIPAKTH